MESLTEEYKREYTDDVKYEVVAFTNTDGGDLWIGIENDGTVCGVVAPDDVLLRTTNAIRDAIRPDVTMFTRADVVERNGKQVVHVTVTRGTARPYYLAGKGIRPEGVYVRQGSSSVPASENAILTMIRETAGDRYEDECSLVQELTFVYAAEYFAARNVEFGEVQRRTLGLVNADGLYTNLALLLSDQCPHIIKAALFDGGTKAVFRDRHELSGSVLKQLEDANDYIDRANKVHADYEGLRRIDSRDYPPQAVREALLNAVVHREYALGNATLVSIFDDRIELVNFGGLMKGIEYDDILLGVSALRNPHLANVFYRLQLIEAYGTGIRKMNEAYAGAPASVRIEVSSNAFKVTLPNMNYRPEKGDVSGRNSGEHAPERGDDGGFLTREERIVALFAKRPRITRQDVQDVLGVSQSTANQVLRELVAQGVLARVGAGRSAAYVLAADGSLR